MTFKRAIIIDEEDKVITKKVLDNSKLLYKQCEDLMVRIDKLPDELRRKLTTAQNNYNRWSEYSKNAQNWYKVADRELNRAIREYDIAYADYEKAHNSYNKAVDRYNSCCRSQRRDDEGRVYPSCNSESKDVDRLRDELNLSKAILTQKEQVKDKAYNNKKTAASSLSMVNSVLPKTKSCLKLSEDAVDFANIAYHACCDSVSSSRSACDLAAKGIELNINQHEYNKQSAIQYEKAEEKFSTTLNAATKMIHLSENCNEFNSLLNSELEYKQGVLNMISSIDLDINIFNAEI